MRINSNTPALSANRHLTDNTKKLNKAAEKLSSGKEVNSAADNAALLQIITREEAEIRFTEQANRNIDFSQAALTIAEGAAQTVTDNEIERAALAVQAANGTNSQAQLQSLQAVDAAFAAESSRVQSQTQYNGIPLNGGSFNVQIGTDSSGGLDVNLPSIAPASGNVSNQASARLALDSYRTNISTIAASRAESGADFARLDSAYQSNAISVGARREAVSQLADADIARASSDYALYKIQQYSSANVLLNAKDQPAQALKLLKA